MDRDGAGHGSMAGRGSLQFPGKGGQYNSQEEKGQGNWKGPWKPGQWLPFPLNRWAQPGQASFLGEKRWSWHLCIAQGFRGSGWGHPLPSPSLPHFLGIGWSPRDMSLFKRPCPSGCSQYRRQFRALKEKVGGQQAQLSKAGGRGFFCHGQTEEGSKRTTLELRDTVNFCGALHGGGGWRT